MAEFAGAFEDADRCEVLDIYAASEEPIPGVTGEALVKAMWRRMEQVEYAASLPRRWRRWCRRRMRGDVILTLGAGSVSQAGVMLLEALKGSG